MQTDLKTMTDKSKLKIRILYDRGLRGKEIKKKFPQYTIRQIASMLAWMRRGKY